MRYLLIVLLTFDNYPPPPSRFQVLMQFGYFEITFVPFEVAPFEPMLAVVHWFFGYLG